VRYFGLIHLICKNRTQHTGKTHGKIKNIFWKNGGKIMSKKRTLILILAVALVFSFSFSTVAFADAPPISVTVDGERVTFEDQGPVIVDDRTLVPVRGVFELMGFEVDWDPDARQATLVSDDYEVIITVGSETFTTNDESHTLDVPAQIIGARTMLPIRAVLESVGYNVYWDHANRTVIVLSMSAMELLVKAEEAMQEVGEFDSVMVMETSIEVAGMVLGMSMTGEMNVFTDPIKMRMAMTTVISDGVEDIEMDAYTYIFHEGDYLVMYMHMMDEWQKLTSPFSQELLDEVMQMQTIEMLSEFYTNAQVVGSERIGGVDTWRVDAGLNMEGAMEIFAGMEGMDDFEELLTEDFFASLGDMTVSMWIAKDGFYTVRMAIDMTEMMSEMLAGLGATVSTVSLSITSSNFGNATEFTLPPEAADATEMGLL
jgi:hypothetical protein